jgi:hypothetical protein
VLLLIIATDLSTYNISIQEWRNNGYKFIILDKAVDEDGITWYQATGIRLEDMKYKIFEIDQYRNFI